MTVLMFTANHTLYRTAWTSPRPACSTPAPACVLVACSCPKYNNVLAESQGFQAQGGAVRSLLRPWHRCSLSLPFRFSTIGADHKYANQAD